MAWWILFHVFKASLNKRWGGLEGCIGLLALQPVPCLSRSCVWGEGHGCPVYKYPRSIGCCATWFNMPVPLSCRSIVAFKPLILYP